MKRIMFMSRREAEHISPKPEEKAAIISINETGDELAVLKEGWVDKLYLVFDDIDKDLSEVIDTRTGKPFNLTFFNSDHAKQITSFVNDIAEDINILVVHCHAGVSRSAAVAKFIAEKYGLKFEHSYSLYNKHVYRVLWNLENGY